MMPGLHLDYQHSNKPLPVAGLLLLALALLLLLATGLYYRSLNARATLWEAKAEQAEKSVQRQFPGWRAGDRIADDLAREVKYANEVLRQLSLPWDGLFQAVESAGGKNVALRALEPDTEKQLVKISGEAKNIAAMLDYIKQLENRDVFGTVYLQSHHVQMQDSERPVRFVLLANWRRKS